MTGARLIGSDPDQLKWGQRRRLDFIEFRLLWEGRVNRAGLTEAFEISEQQASLDIARYQEVAPGNLFYDVKARAYLRSSEFEPRLVANFTDRFLLQLMAIRTGQIPKGETLFGDLPPSKVAALPHEPTRWDVVMWIARAIRQNREIEIKYASLTTSSRIIRRVAPHAIGYGSGRWHMRAWSREYNEFRDYSFDRIDSVTDIGSSPVDASWDIAWHTDFGLRIAPNPALPEKVQKTVAAERGMKRGKLTVSLPIALCFYLINDLNLDLAKKVHWGDGTGNSVLPHRLQLILENWEEYDLAKVGAKEESKRLLRRDA